MGAFADSGALLILAFTVLPVLYLLPTLIGAIRRVDGLALICLINLIGAPTGVGWLAAMILAFGPKRLPPPSPAPVGNRSRRAFDALLEHYMSSERDTCD